MFAVDCSEQMCNWMLNEDNVILVGCATQDPYMEAYKATEDVILQLTGEKIPEKLGVVTYLDATSLNIGDRDAVKAYLEHLKGFSGN